VSDVQAPCSAVCVGTHDTEALARREKTEVGYSGHGGRSGWGGGLSSPMNASDYNLVEVFGAAAYCFALHARPRDRRSQRDRCQTSVGSPESHSASILTDWRGTLPTIVGRSRRSLGQHEAMEGLRPQITVRSPSPAVEETRAASQEQSKNECEHQHERESQDILSRCPLYWRHGECPC